jgi:hypothetical protein
MTLFLKLAGGFPPDEQGKAAVSVQSDGLDGSKFLGFEVWFGWFKFVDGPEARKQFHDGTDPG